jgi:putative tricarboxylic transport membrane protein
MIKNINLLSGLVGIVIAGFVLYLISNFPASQSGSIGPDFFPKFLAYGLGVFSFILAVTALTSKSIEKFETFSFTLPGVRRALLSIMVTVIYCLLIEIFGFIACTIVYLLVLMFMLKERHYMLMVFSACSISMVVFSIFSIFLNITLPLGTLYGF